MKIIYARYGTIDAIEEETSISRAKERLERMEDNGDCFGIGIYDETDGIFYFDNTVSLCNPITRTELIEQKLSALKELNIIPSGILGY